MGEGPLGFHQGKPVWTQEAAEDRRKALAGYNHRTWIEVYQEGAWKRLGTVTVLEQPPTSE
jgi:hypothetical protein